MIRRNEANTIKERKTSTKCKKDSSKRRTTRELEKDVAKIRRREDYDRGSNGGAIGPRVKGVLWGRARKKIKAQGSF